MKNKDNPTLHDKNNSTSSTAGGNAPVHHIFKLGLDVDLRTIVAAIQCDRGAIALPQKFSRARLVQWVKEKTSAGHEVHTVYESCGFGYRLHHELTAAGAHSLLTTPLLLSPERRRKNDRIAEYI
jgi:transposase